MSEGWERRLAAGVIARAFEDLLTPEPGSLIGKRREDRLGRSKRNEWRRSWLGAADFLFTPEAEKDRKHWFATAKLRLPETSEGMVAAVQRYAAGPVLDDEDDDEPFEEPAVEEPVLDTQDDHEEDELAAA